MATSAAVDKPGFLLRYANDFFSPTFITSIGIDFKIKNIVLHGNRIKLQIWDTAGQERFPAMMTSFVVRRRIIDVFRDRSTIPKQCQKSLVSPN
jgi:GTPase SAR1 family protein